MTRQDHHRPSVIEPADYTILEGPGAFHYYWKEWSVCAHCGHALKYAVRFRHKDGEVIDVGQDCAILLDTADRVEYEMTQFRKYIAKQRDDIAREQKNEARREEMLKNDPDVVEYLDTINPNCERFSFLVNMIDAMDHYGSLTEGQINAVRNIMKKREEIAARQLAEVEPTTPAPEGRVQVEGVVLSIKVQDTDFGSVIKMLVKLDDNNKVWGSLPSSLRTDIKGERIRFTGTFTQSKTDEHFSIFKRPAKAEIL
jgi:hypothetical protein